MRVRTLRVPSFPDTEKNLAIVRAAHEGVADAALVRKLIADKAAELSAAGIKPAVDPQERLLH